MGQASRILRSPYVRSVVGLVIAAVLTVLAVGLAGRGISPGVRLFVPQPDDGAIEWAWRLMWFAHVGCLAALGWTLMPRERLGRGWPLTCVAVALAMLLMTPMLWFGTVADFGDRDYPEERAMRSVILWLPLTALVTATVGVIGFLSRDRAIDGGGGSTAALPHRCATPGSSHGSRRQEHTT